MRRLQFLRNGKYLSNLIPERHGQTDGHTDGQSCYINNARQSAAKRPCDTSCLGNANTGLFFKPGLTGLTAFKAGTLVPGFDIW